MTPHKSRISELASEMIPSLIGDTSRANPSPNPNSTASREQERRTETDTSYWYTRHHRYEASILSLRLFASLDWPYSVSDSQSTTDTRTLFDSSTVELDHTANIVGEIVDEFETLFANARGEFFEDGMESEFSRGLWQLLDKYDWLGIDVLTGLIIREVVNPEIASEALRWIGHNENPSTHIQRLRLLERSLWHSSPYIRDGAILGLASLDDPSALPYLQKALEKENNKELRKDIQQVIDQLVETMSEQN